MMPSARAIPHVILLICLASLTPAADSAADSAAISTSTWSEVMAHAPELAAARARLRAAQRASAGAGILPDPRLIAQAIRRQGHDTRVDNLGIEQEFPRWHERTAAIGHATATIAMAEADLAMAIGTIAAETANALATIEAETALAELADAQAVRAQSLLATVDANIAASRGTLADRLLIETRIDALHVDADNARRQVEDARADLRVRLGLPDEAALPRPPLLTILSDSNSSLTPEMRAARARQADASAQAQAASSRRYPSSALELRWGISDDDRYVSAEFKVGLPFHQDAAAAEEDAAAANAAAARLEEQAAQRRASTAHARVVRAAASAATAHAVASATGQRVQAELNSALRNAGTDAAPSVTALVDLLDRLGDAQRGEIEADARARQAAAELWRFFPPDCPESP